MTTLANGHALPTVHDPRITQLWPHEWSLTKHLLSWGYVGSVQHGTHGEVIDDVDLLAIVFPPIVLDPFEHWVLQHEELDVLVYSLAKYLRLLAKANPNMLATLDPEVGLWVGPNAPLRERLLRAVQCKAALHHAAGYARGQFAKLLKGEYQGYMGVERKKLHDQFGFDPKSAAHTIRILRFALDFAHDHVRAKRPDAAELRVIKAGGWSLEQVTAEVRRLHEELAECALRSRWPDHADRTELDKVYYEFVRDNHDL
jgi:hypothetical protein